MIPSLLLQILKAVREGFSAVGQGGAAQLSRIEQKIDALQKEQAAQSMLLDHLSLEVRDVQRGLGDAQRVLDSILSIVAPSPAVGFAFTIEIDGIIQKGAITMTNSQKATITIEPVDTKGKPAPIDGIPVWAVSDDTKGVLTPAADGLSAVFAASGPLGSVTVSVSGDADLGADVIGIFGEIVIVIIAGRAVGFKLTLGEATEQ